MKEFKRVTKYVNKFFSITNVQNSKYPSFETGYSGFLGIQPFTKDDSRKEENFMWQLREMKLIDHLTVSFYIVNDDKNFDKVHSIIKFGSMDR